MISIKKNQHGLLQRYKKIEKKGPEKKTFEMKKIKKIKKMLTFFIHQIIKLMIW